MNSLRGIGLALDAQRASILTTARMLKALTASKVIPRLGCIQPLRAEAEIPSVSTVGNGTASDAALAAGLESSSFKKKLGEKKYAA
jgi:hypothetical protein